MRERGGAREIRSPSQSHRRECLSECGSERGGGVGPPSSREREQSSGRGPPGRVCMLSRVRATIRTDNMLLYSPAQKKIADDVSELFVIGFKRILRFDIFRYWNCPSIYMNHTDNMPSNLSKKFHSFYPGGNFRAGLPPPFG